jgi:rhodanese-related sulfurtransferase
MLVSPAEFVAKTKATIKECSVRDVHECLNAVLIPRGMLEFEILPTLERRGIPLAPDECDIVLYCGTGGRSALAAKSMDDMGFRNVRSMDGGIVAWAEAKLPIDVPG